MSQPRPRDNTIKIAQLNVAKAGYEIYIANLEAANDGVDRSGAIASERKCLAAIEKQIADLAPRPEPKADPMPVAVSKSSPT